MSGPGLQVVATRTDRGVTAEKNMTMVFLTTRNNIRTTITEKFGESN